jgi:methylenetetrahydrofolate dehydrogenase (NADP+) / methenyltetrahydrofolate cyclohydrolase
METKIFSGKILAEKILHNCKMEAQEFESHHARKACLAVILVGNDPASSIYVKKKTETCKNAGLEVFDYPLNPELGLPALKRLVKELNERADVDGILVQSPLPKGWDEKEIQSMIYPLKDVDGFHPNNAGELSIDANKTLEKGLPPCTPAGVIEILKEAKIPIAGKKAVVLGRSNIVGKPMSLMLLAQDATVTICHSKTENLAALCKEADILVSAIGKTKFVNADFVKKGAAVIDVGINRLQKDGKNIVVGDVDAAAVTSIAGFLTPVPNGVGPITIALLIRNTLRAAKKRSANA